MYIHLASQITKPRKSAACTQSNRLLIADPQAEVSSSKNQATQERNGGRLGWIRALRSWEKQKS
jgi:hypothetical protein